MFGEINMQKLRYWTKRIIVFLCLLYAASYIIGPVIWMLIEYFSDNEQHAEIIKYKENIIESFNTISVWAYLITYLLITPLLFSYSQYKNLNFIIRVGICLAFYFTIIILIFSILYLTDLFNK